MISASNCFAVLWVAVSLPGRLSAVTPQRLAQHSLSFPESLALNDWFVSGPAMSTESELVLNPGKLDDVSMAWSRFPIPSNDFEVKVDIAASVDEEDSMGGFLEYDGLAIWYVHENSDEASRIDSRNHKRAKKKKPGKGFDLFGFKGLYDGLGIFLFFDAGSPMITAVEGNGNKRVLREDVLGSPGGIGLYNAFHGDKAKGEITIKIRIDPYGVRIEVPGFGDMKVPVGLDGGGHLGFTALSARWDWEGEATARRVSLKRLEVLNHEAEQEETHTADVGLKDEELDEDDDYHEKEKEDAEENAEEAEGSKDEGTQEIVEEDQYTDMELEAEMEADELLRGSKTAGAKPSNGGAPALAPAQLRADVAALRTSIGQLTEEVKELRTGVEAHEAVTDNIDGKSEL